MHEARILWSIDFKLYWSKTSRPYVMVNCLLSVHKLLGCRCYNSNKYSLIIMKLWIWILHMAIQDKFEFWRIRFTGSGLSVSEFVENTNFEGCWYSNSNKYSRIIMKLWI